MHVSSSILGSRAPAVARRFGVRELPGNPALVGLEESVGQVAGELRPGRVVLITGASGSGKSSLLAAVERRLGGQVVCVHDVHLPDEMVVDCFPQLELEEALEVLCQFGLGEVYTYLSPARKLSTGQQFRLRLAMAWARARACHRASVILCDEFATQLDVVSAGVIGRLVRRLVSADGRLALVAASCHDGIAQALKPDVVVRCDFGQVTIGEELAA